ncbi:hypothetical protein [Nocardiopsis salina]|uniref:hypothetical protein n=1 Tax=Nocardiopsis salina TaxID=245836 RepID=UPI00034A810A|nr:hypothetical protein [Nocardiopsis salina]
MAERPAGTAGGGERTDTSGTGQEGPEERADRTGAAEDQVAGSGAAETGGTPSSGGEGPGHRPVRRKPARKNRPLTPAREQGPAQRAPSRRDSAGPTPQGAAEKASGRPWEGEPWRVVPRGMDLARVKERWTGAQGGFVDDPEQAVRDADALAAEVAEAVVEGIEERRARLRAVWDAGPGETDTESLRLVLREYRAYVERLTGD